MFGISFNELVLIILLMVIFIKPKDIPSVVNAIARVFKKLKNFLFEIQTNLKNITDEIDDTEKKVYKTFHEQVEDVRLKIEQEENFNLFDDDYERITPKLKFDKPARRKK